MSSEDVVFKRKLRDIGNILGISFPPELVEFIGAKKNDRLRMSARSGKSGRGVCIWKDECDQDEPVH